MAVEGVAGRSVLVTGAAGGIGAAVARIFEEAGATVARWDTAGVAGADLRAGGTLAVDVTDADAVAAGFTATEEAVGPVSILVHAAGVLRTGSGLDRGGDWDTCMAVNATGTRNVAGEAARRFVAAVAAGADPGVIVGVSSNAAATPRAAMAAYGASKAAATAYLRSLGLELAPHGIRCNVISPGSTDTPMLRGMWAAGSDESASVIAGDASAFRLGIPLGRIAHPDDIARTALFLCSDAARHITLHDLRVDGGATLDM
ncbi:SDR family oxidoreductase [Rhodococcus sp. NPDC058505]|uniref:SDR family oxidoreductase n=1 Tax=unclassified Rhodococcus (in: high G+C Gram-positive bacteria) TaxID=192944 RepID=UPI00365407C1